MASDGTFVLADIGGYTQFLTGVGIEHGKEITSHLLNGLLKTNRGRWKVGNIVGDCLFFYSGREDPAATFAQIRAIYEGFRAASTDIAARSHCPCGACTRTATLSLKFVVHSGVYDTQAIGDRTELIGSDVVVAHRLLKNSVPVEEYVLFTAGARPIAEASGLPQVAHSEEYDVGQIDGVYVDLEPVRDAFEASRQFYLTADGSRVVVTEEIEAAAEVVWNAIVDTPNRGRWQKTIKKLTVMEGREGRIGEVHRCVHDAVTKIIHVTVAIDQENMRKTEKVWLMPLLMKDTAITMEVVRISDTRCRVSLYGDWGPNLPLASQVIAPVITRMMTNDVRKDMAGLKALCEQEAKVAR